MNLIYSCSQLSLIFHQSLKIPFKKNSSLLNRLIKKLSLVGSSAWFIVLKNTMFHVLYNSFIIKWQETFSNDVMQVSQILRAEQVT